MNQEFKELLIGAGVNHQKRFMTDAGDQWQNVTKLDIVDHPGIDVIWDLERLGYPFDDNTFDEIHAYEVLEHTGQQGDYKFFFKQFSEFWRILKPDGIICATVPAFNSIWAWADPGHTRVINEGSLVFLSQGAYKDQVGKTRMSDYRSFYRADFRTEYQAYESESFVFCIRAIKEEQTK